MLIYYISNFSIVVLLSLILQHRNSHMNVMNICVLHKQCFFNGITISGKAQGQLYECHEWMFTLLAMCLSSRFIVSDAAVQECHDLYVKTQTKM